MTVWSAFPGELNSHRHFVPPQVAQDGRHLTHRATRKVGSVTISDTEISRVLATHLAHCPNEVESLSEPVRLLSRGKNFASRWTFPMHVTVGALLVRRDTEVLLVDHRAYGILLQPGGHLEPTDTTLFGAALRELVEETGVDPERSEERRVGKGGQDRSVPSVDRQG